MRAFYLLVSRLLQRVRWYALAGFLSVFAACGGGNETPSFSIGGQVSGMAQAGSVTLQNGSEQLTVSDNGAFFFQAAVPLGGAYNVTVLGQSAGQTCSLAANSGSGAGINSNIRSIRITCSVFNYTVGGSVSGLQGSTVTLINNGTNSLAVNANGDFIFSSPVAFGGSYNVAVGAQPNGQTCSVSAGAGSGINANVSSVAVICSTNTFSINGNVSGASNTVTLSLNGANFLSLPTNGPFGFAQQVAFGGSYNVAVSTNPIGQTCTVNNGIGNNVIVDVANINVLCSTNTFTVSGNATGLQGTVTLNLNGGSPLSIASNGSFTFATLVSFGGNYSVTVVTQPVGQSCSVSNSSGSLVTANVQNVNITCLPLTYTIGGNVSGLQGTVTLSLNGGSPLSIGSNGSFTFASPISFGGSYSVAVATQPAGQSCSVSNGSGRLVSANVQNISISCVLNTFTVGGASTGVSANNPVTLQLTLAGGSVPVESIQATTGSFTFTTRLTAGTNYSVSFVAGPDRSCTLTNASGTMGSADVTNLVLACQLSKFPLTLITQGVVTGETLTMSLTFNDGRGNTTSQSVIDIRGIIYIDFIGYGTDFSLILITSPPGKSCSVTNGTGTNVTTAPPSATVSCFIPGPN